MGIIVRWLFRKWNVRAWTGSTWLRIGTGNEHSGSINCGEFLDYLRTN